MDENGFSFVEALLTLTILITVFGSLLPFASHMTSVLIQKKQAMRAAETAYQGMILYSAYGIELGSRTIEDDSYDWIIDGNTICVYYITDQKEAMKCVD
ncbi:hypothetical protein ACXYMX_06250 [Sporosarcina sp. CAU 1771]